MIPHGENACHSIFITWKLYGKQFFQKKKINQIFLSPVCSTNLKKPKKWFIFFSSCFSKKYENCMTNIFSILLMYGIVCYVFCCMELYDKLFRCMKVNPGSLFLILGRKLLKKCNIFWYFFINRVDNFFHSIGQNMHQKVNFQGFCTELYIAIKLNRFDNL